MTAYVVTCTPSGKRYIGITRRTVAERWSQHVSNALCGRHKTALTSAIVKYGPLSFVVEPLCCSRSWEDLCEVEAILIKQEGTLSPGGYNLTFGGEGIVGYTYPREIVSRIAAKHRGVKRSPASIEKSAAFHRGRKRSDEHRKRVSEARRGKKLSLAHRAKLSAAKLGKPMGPLSAEHCARISDGLRRAWVRRRGGVHV